MFRNDRNNTAAYEQQAKFIQDRISGVEKHFAELCSIFGDYARKTARLRDKGDDVAKAIKDYAESETVNKSLCNGLNNLSLTISAIEEYRNAEVLRLETKVIGELSQYDVICKHAREEVKHTLSVRDRELTRKKVLEKARERHPFNRQQITNAESELMKASAEMSRTARSLSEQTDLFERRKLQQLKSILLDFVKIEMAFHCKALELLTVSHKQVHEINERADLELLKTGLNRDGEDKTNFRKKLKSPEVPEKIDEPQRSGSLGSLLNHQRSKSNETLDSIESAESGNSEETDDSNNHDG